MGFGGCPLVLLIWLAVRCIKSAVRAVEQTWKSKRSMRFGMPDA
jgi:hypothetical protein